LLNVARVLVNGGGYSQALSSAELYDPALNTWSPAGNMGFDRVHHTAPLLLGRQGLVTGGSFFIARRRCTSSEIYDPTTNSWFAGGNTCRATRAPHRHAVE
jgi:hypothetical protein